MFVQPAAAAVLPFEVDEIRVGREAARRSGHFTIVVFRGLPLDFDLWTRWRGVGLPIAVVVETIADFGGGGTRYTASASSLTLAAFAQRRRVTASLRRNVVDAAVAI